MSDKGEEQEDQVERKNEIQKKKRDNGESLCQNGRGGTRVQEKKNEPWFSQEAWTLVDQKKTILNRS